LREWFAGLAIGNVELMRGVDPEHRALVALKVADQLINALAAPRRLSPTSLMSPSDDDMKRWDASLAEIRAAQDRQARDTLPSAKRVQSSTKKTILGVAAPSNPPVGYVPTPSATPMTRDTVPAVKKVIVNTSPSRYSVTSPSEGTTIPLPTRRKI